MVIIIRFLGGEVTLERTLLTVEDGRNNNLDFIRFLASIMVIFSHSFPLSLGEEIDPLFILTKEQIGFGSLGVAIFFVYGGYLICKSMHRVKKAKPYFLARVLRIFPPLAAVTIVLAFIIGPILSTLSVGDYFRNPETYRYLLNAVLIPQHNLPGVFEHNAYLPTVNGPLWTLPVEFICYIMCFVFYKLKLLDKKHIIITICLFGAGITGAYLLSGHIAVLASMIRPMGLFFIGMLAYIFRDKIRMSFGYFLISGFGMVISIALGIFPYTIYIFLPYFLLYLGFATKRKFSQFARKGEISYGMYLCAWPIQQILCQCFGGQMHPMMNFILATVLSILAGVILLKTIEEPVMRWKQTLTTDKYHT